MIGRFVFFAVLVGGVGTGAFAQGITDSDVQQHLLACFDGGTTLKTRYDCMGQSAQNCMRQQPGQPDHHVLPCATAEVSGWQWLHRREKELVADTIRAAADSDDPCEPSVQACLAQLDAMVADATTAMDRKCALESQPENAAAMPELADTLCRLRETARMTVTLADLRERITP